MDVRMRTRVVDRMIDAGAVMVAIAATTMMITIGVGSTPGVVLVAMLVLGLVLAVSGILTRFDRQGEFCSQATRDRLHRARQYQAKSPAQPVRLD